MNHTPQPASFYIGWDVGGWNCDRNSKSRDGVVILDATLGVVGSPWRGNLRQHINEAATSGAWLAKLFTLCASNPPTTSVHVTLAIDAPLGFSDSLVGLTTDLNHASSVEDSAANPYLFRQTERYLFRCGLTPLSAVKDMIGSQATKAMHVLAKFAREMTGVGVWIGRPSLVAIEAYPAACSESATISQLRRRYPPFDCHDKHDALTCALIAYLFANRREALQEPGSETPTREGWIWVPKDALKKERV